MTASIKKPLRVAMIGGGGMTREHIRAFQNVPGVTVAGIWNRTRDKAEALVKEFAIRVRRLRASTTSMRPPRLISPCSPSTRLRSIRW